MMLLLLGSSVVHAQQRDTIGLPDSADFRIPAIEVIGSIVMTAAGPSIRSGLAGRTVSVTGEELRAWRPATVADALGGASATVYDDLGSALKQSVVLRGFSVGPVVGMPQGVSVFIDGVPMNEPGSGEVSFDLLPLEHVERIEVLTGTASLLGPNSLGGAINLLTHRGGGSARTSFELEAGSHQLFGGAASTGGEIGAWDYYAGGGHEREEGWRRRMSGKRSHLFATVGTYGTGSGVRLQVLAAQSDAETAGSLPLSVYAVQPDSNLTAGDFEALRQIQLAASAYTALFGGLASARVFVRGNSAERFNANQEDDPDIRAFSENKTIGAHADWRAANLRGANGLSVRGGVGASANRTAVRMNAERVEPGETTNVESPIRRFDAYAVADWSAGPATFSAGVRLDAVRVPFRNLRNPARDTTSTFVHTSPRASIALRMSEHLSTHASAGKGFRAPALIEIACADPQEPCPLPFALGDDPPITAVRVTTYDAGIRWQSRNVSADVAFYRSNVRDDIFLFPYEDADEPAGSTIDGYFGNVARTRREGLEAGARARISGRFSAWGSYALSRATFESADLEIFSIREAAGAENEVEVGDRFPLVPAATLSAGVDGVIDRFEIGVAVAHVGRRYLRGDEANDEAPLESYTIADVRAGFDIAGWELTVLLRNAMNSRYINFGTFNINQGAGDQLERFVTPGAPRRLKLSIGRTFND